LITVGSRVFSLAEKSMDPKAIQVFHPGELWKRIGRSSPGDSDYGPTTVEQDIEDLQKDCYWTFLSPNEDMICYFADKEYIAVYDVQSGNLKWCHRLHGDKIREYWMEKPIFHPTKPLLAWTEQFGKDREDFDVKRHCSVYFVDLCSPENAPVKIEGVTGKHPPLHSHSQLTGL